MQSTTMTNRSSNVKAFMDYPWTKTKEDVTHHYDVDEDIGLAEERIRRDFEHFGPNGNLNKYMINFKTIFFM
jgi:hypothetical protein